MNGKIKPCGWAWIGLVGYVTIVDVILLRMEKHYGEPFNSMSEGFGRSLRHPIRRWPVIAAWVAVTVHLFGAIIPKRFEGLKYVDPVGILARFLGGRKPIKDTPMETPYN